MKSDWPKRMDEKVRVIKRGPYFGTHEDVALLREEAEGEWNGEQMETGRRLLHLAKRIEALLPPKQ